MLNTTWKSRFVRVWAMLFRPTAGLESEPDVAPPAPGLTPWALSSRPCGAGRKIPVVTLSSQGLRPGLCHHAPAGLVLKSLWAFLYPRAHALGYIITPLRGWTQNPCCDPFIPRLTPWAISSRPCGAGHGITPWGRG